MTCICPPCAWRSTPPPDGRCASNRSPTRSLHAMAATIIDGKKISDLIKEEVRRDTALLKERSDVVPGLAFLLVGDNPASLSYVRSKGKACAFCGFHSTTVEKPADTSQEEVLELIDRWNIDPHVHGILVQLPLPKHIDEHKVIRAISSRKDVDGFHP